MTMTLAPPRNQTREPADWPTASTPEEDFPSGTIIALRRDALPQARSPEPYIKHGRRWLLTGPRREALIGSTGAFLVSLAIAWVLSGIMTYLFALWTNGPI